MSGESLIGFAFLFVVTTLVASLVLGGVALAFGRRLRAAGPRVERVAYGLALLAPPAAASVLVVVLATFSIAGPWWGVADHCGHHAHHLHLCLRHGASWGAHAWAVASIAGTSVFLAVHVGRRIFRVASARAAVARLVRAATTREVRGGTVLVVPSTRAFSFVSGVRRPRIFVSAAAWELLAEDERAAMLAHERAHVAQGDLGRGLVLDLAALLGAPGVARRCLGRWEDATERLCDHVAVAEVGVAPLARALLAMAGAPDLRTAVPGAAFVRDGGAVVTRVEAVLEGTRDGIALARLLSAAAAIGAGTAVLVVVTRAGAVHHLIESVLGRL